MFPARGEVDAFRTDRLGGPPRRHAAPGATSQPIRAPRSATPPGGIDTTLSDDERLVTGLTLDAAIERMMAANLDIQAFRHELPQSEPDIVTFGLPISNRNQGNIARAVSNVQQTRQELSSAERRVASEVRLAEREFPTSKRAVEHIEKTLLPQLHESLRRRAEQFAKDDISLEDFQSHMEQAAEIAQSHRDALIRHRRSMLDLNTAVGLRLLP